MRPLAGPFLGKRRRGSPKPGRRRCFLLLRVAYEIKPPASPSNEPRCPTAHYRRTSELMLGGPAVFASPPKHSHRISLNLPFLAARERPRPGRLTSWLAQPRSPV